MLSADRLRRREELKTVREESAVQNKDNGHRDSGQQTEVGCKPASVPNLKLYYKKN